MTTQTHARGRRAFLVTAAGVHLGNYAFNLVLGQQLGPAAFAELHLVVTFLLVLTLATHTVQLAAARATAEVDVTAGRTEAEVQHRAVRTLARRGGIAIGIASATASPFLANTFGSPSRLPYVLFGLGMPALLLLGADRGRLQGTLDFLHLARTNVVEMATRLGLGITLVHLGLGVDGAVLAITTSFVVAALVARPRAASRRAANRLVLQAGPAGRRHDRRIGRSVPLLLGPTFALLAGQVLAANGDVLVVKATQPAVLAGQYAVLALLGRVVFYATATLVELGFPVVARRRPTGADGRAVLALGLGLTGAMGAVAVTTLFFAGDAVVSLAFGDAYLPIAPLAWRYTLATSLFSLAYVLASDGLAQGRSRLPLVLVVGGALQLLAVLAHRSDLSSVVDAQVVSMGLLLVATAAARRAPDATRRASPRWRRPLGDAVAPRPLAAPAVLPGADA